MNAELDRHHRLYRRQQTIGLVAVTLSVLANIANWEITAIVLAGFGFSFVLFASQHRGWVKGYRAREDND